MPRFQRGKSPPSHHGDVLIPSVRYEADASTKDGWSITMKKLCCGGIAGTIAKTSIAPLERVKILFQVNNIHYPYTGVPSTVYRIYLREGFAGLYRGNLSSVARVFPYAAIQFTVFDKFKLLFTPERKEISPVGNLAAGACAGATAVIFTYPLDMTRARLAVQVTKTQYNGMLHALAHMWKYEGGIKALYRGLQPTMIGIFPYAGLNFFTYDTLKWYYLNRWNESDDKELSTTMRLVFGGVAGAFGQTMTYPLDVVRRRMQIDGLKLEKTYTYQYGSTWSAMKTIFRQEGIWALYRGLQINYIKVVPLVAVSFTVNDTLRQWMGLNTGGGVKR